MNYTLARCQSTKRNASLLSNLLISTDPSVLCPGLTPFFIDYAPFGEEISSVIGGRGGVTGYGVDEGLRQKFTGKERDTETGLDEFGARYYSNSLGRFMQPDRSPLGIAMADPQSWNLFSYVRNRPTRFVDIGGNWATDVHAQIVTFALQGYLSAGELQELVNRQYVMDADQSDQQYLGSDQAN
jgi:RHS repeat-associated protein